MNRIHLIVLAVWTAFNFVEAKSVKANSEGIRAVVQLVPARNSEGFIPGAYIQDGKLKNAEGKAMQVRTRGQWKLISSESPIEPIEGSYEWIGPMVMLIVVRETAIPFRHSFTAGRSNAGYHSGRTRRRNSPMCPRCTLGPQRPSPLQERRSSYRQADSISTFHPGWH